MFFVYKTICIGISQHNEDIKYNGQSLVFMHDFDHFLSNKIDFDSLPLKQLVGVLSSYPLIFIYSIDMDFKTLSPFLTLCPFVKCFLLVF